MLTVPSDVQQRLQQHGQEHVLRWWPELTAAERQALLAQLCALDLAQLKELYAAREQVWTMPPEEMLAPLPLTTLDERDEPTRQRGEEALRAGQVAVLIVAGGQGSRLGFTLPKGMLPITPVAQKTLFQLHAEKVRALGQRYGRPLPLLVMTSPATDADTRAYFQEQRFFGLEPSQVHYFTQGTMPALDLATGRLLLEERGRIFTSPNGHGGTLYALHTTGLLDQLRHQGIDTIFYFQVDNPLVRIADPLFLGHHLAHRAEVSSKVIPKQSPADKLGNLLLIDGRCQMIEYSDLPPHLAEQRDARGQLRFAAGNPAIHLFDVPFLQRVLRGGTALPYHLARKKVPCVNEAGQRIEPKQENACKFEMFIFDVLPLAERWTAVTTTRAEEFEPVKNATGADSPATAQQALSNLAARWLEQAGVAVPRDAAGNSVHPLEISPLLALDAAELRARLPAELQIAGPLHLDAHPSEHTAPASAKR